MESEIRISTIMMRESAEPTFQLPSVRNFASIRSPNIIVLPPPKTRGMKNVVTEGMKTIVMPLTMPGMDSGMVTFHSVCQLLQPRSAAASVRR